MPCPPSRVRQKFSLACFEPEPAWFYPAIAGRSTLSALSISCRNWNRWQPRRVDPSRPDSYERLCHDSGVPRFLLDLRAGRHEALRWGLLESRLELFIGVIYRPETELQSHNSEAVLRRQLDAWVCFDETSAITPLGPKHARPGASETYPFGFRTTADEGGSGMPADKSTQAATLEEGVIFFFFRPRVEKDDPDSLGNV